MDFSQWKLAFCAFLFSLKTVNTLECYACHNQDSNKDKCIKTTKQCDQGMNSCMTWVRWGIPPYWTPHGDRIHFISKDCTTINQCATLQRDSMSHCKRDWYADWGCYECCAGDLCNYYVTLAGNNLQPRLAILLFGISAVLYFWTMRR